MNESPRAEGRLNFAALTIPIDIKNQYAFSRLLEVDAVVMENNTTTAQVTIEFSDKTFDHWDIPLRGDNAWMSWFGWRKANSGTLNDGDAETEAWNPTGDEVATV